MRPYAAVIPDVLLERPRTRSADAGSRSMRSTSSTTRQARPGRRLPDLLLRLRVRAASRSRRGPSQGLHRVSRDPREVKARDSASSRSRAPRRPVSTLWVSTSRPRWTRSNGDASTHSPRCGRYWTELCPGLPESRGQVRGELLDPRIDEVEPEAVSPPGVPPVMRGHAGQHGPHRGRIPGPQADDVVRVRRDSATR